MIKWTWLVKFIFWRYSHFDFWLYLGYREIVRLLLCLLFVSSFRTMTHGWTPSVVPHPLRKKVSTLSSSYPSGPYIQEDPWTTLLYRRTILEDFLCSAKEQYCWITIVIIKIYDVIFTIYSGHIRVFGLKKSQYLV